MDGAVLLAEDGDEGFIGLYLHKRVLDILDSNDPRKTLDNDNYDPFLTAIEETSHLTYLLNRNMNDRQCTIMEQELQGYIDRFLLVSFHANRLMGGIPSAVTDRFLNERMGSTDNYSDDAIRMYRDVNRLGSRYAGFLYDNLMTGNSPRPFKREVIDFYSRSQLGKIERIRDATGMIIP
jgi:hypothetical protein